MAEVHTSGCPVCKEFEGQGDAEIPAMRRRRLQPHWLLDRSGSCGAIDIIYDLRDDFDKLLFCLAALT